MKGLCVGGAWKMKITAYQINANMLREAQRVMHQQNLKQLEILNRQAELAHKTKEIQEHIQELKDVINY